MDAKEEVEYPCDVINSEDIENTEIEPAPRPSASNETEPAPKPTVRDGQPTSTNTTDAEDEEDESFDIDPR